MNVCERANDFKTLKINDFTRAFDLARFLLSLVQVQRGSKKHLVRSVHEGEAVFHVVNPVSEGWRGGRLLFAANSFAQGVGCRFAIAYLSRVSA